MKIRTAVLPVAGWGTRFLPATKAVPKELLPIIDRPAIQYAIEEAVASGIERVILVTSEHKRAIEDHFDISSDLEAILEQRGDIEHLRAVRAVADMVHLVTIRQKEQLGLGHAVLMAQDAVGHEPFSVMLPDDLIFGATPHYQRVTRVERFRFAALSRSRTPHMHHRISPSLVATSSARKSLSAWSRQPMGSMVKFSSLTRFTRWRKSSLSSRGTSLGRDMTLALQRVGSVRTSTSRLITRSMDQLCVAQLPLIKSASRDAIRS